MESRTRILEESPSRIVLRESFMPWRWGGLQLSRIFLVPLLWLFQRLILGKKIVFDRAYQDMNVENRILFVHRRTQTHFSDVESVTLSPREIKEALHGYVYVGPVPIHVKDLSLLLHDGTHVRIATAYKESTQLEVLGKRLGELTGKPFVTSQDEMEGNENSLD